MKKKFTLLLTCMLVVCSFLLAGCSEVPGITGEVADEYFEKTDAVFQEVFAISDKAEINAKTDYYTEIGDSGYIALYQAWGNEKKNLGTYQEGQTPSYKVTESEDSGKYAKAYACEITYKFSERDAVGKIIYDKDGNVASISLEGVYTLGEKMEKAALNTVLGMGSVFIVLIIIIIVISISGWLIPKIEKGLDASAKKRAAKKAAKNKTAEPEIVTPATPVAPAARAVDETGMDDGELIAVIAAAIAAYQQDNGIRPEEDDGSGLVVRSIRKVQNSKWRRA